MQWIRVLLVAVILTAAALAESPVVLISVDGLRPDYVTNSHSCPQPFPTLRAFLTEGTYADGVVGVTPTVTYPSHTTLVTGVDPAQHGIWGNTVFDPQGQNMQGWYWYAEDIKADTLWDAARRKGLVSASLGWPVTAGSTAIRYNIPEYWRAGNLEDRKLQRALSTPELYDAIAPELRSFPIAEGAYLDTDKAFASGAIWAIRQKNARLVTVHLGALDHMEHVYAPFSPQACQTLAELDHQVDRIERAAWATNPQTVLAIVSDHGFSRTDHRLNLTLAFAQAGLLTIAPGWQGKLSVTSWRAAPYANGGTIGVVLRDPNDRATAEQVRQLLHKLAADPANGLATILEKPAIDKLGGYPNAQFLIDLNLDFQAGDALSGALVTPAPSTGMHGYLPSHPEMRASFFLRGRGIAHGRDLGTIDMRQIAPTLAHLLGVTLRDARQPALAVTH